jgi:uncharacterized phage protein (TIGR01671 family)
MKMREIKVRYVLKHTKSGQIVKTIYTLSQIETGKDNIISPWFMSGYGFELIGRDQYAGLKDKNGKEIFEGDITEIELENGEIRRFLVRIKTVVRKVVSHSSFSDDTAMVAITGVVFEWNGFELFPCVNEKGWHDNEYLMRVIGNIHENPELVEERDGGLLKCYESGTL